MSASRVYALLSPSVALSSLLKLKFSENIWRGGAVLWVDVRSESAKIGNSLLDSAGFGQGRGVGERGGEKCRVRDRRNAVFVVGPCSCSWIGE
jgi:hypothetical protein